MYAHLEKITSTQEFYVADDKLINIIRPTLIKAQREVAAYEKKRDAIKGKVNMAEANRVGTGSIFNAESVGEKLFNAASYFQAGAKEAACRTELAMIERQILGFKEEFGVELYPIFHAMEDNEGWLPTDRKVRSLYDSAREDISEMEKSKDTKKEQIKELDGVEGSGLSPPTIPSQPAVTPTVVATPVPGINSQVGGQTPWASAEPSYGTSYGSQSTEPSNNMYGSAQASANNFGSINNGQPQMQHQNPNNSSISFRFMQNQPVESTNNAMGGPVPTQQFGNNNAFNTSVFDPFDGLASTSTNQTNPASFNSAPAPNAFDPFSNKQASGTTLSDADMSLFKY